MSPSLLRQWLVKPLLAAAAAFERDMAATFDAAAEAVRHEPAADVFRRLAREERQHEQQLHALPADSRLKGVPEPGLAFERLSAPGITSEDARDLAAWLARVRGKEQAIGAFYRALGAKAVVPEVARVFEWLAGEEDRHLAQLDEIGRMLDGRPDAGA